MSHFLVYSLVGCPYSKRSEDLVKDMKFEHKIVLVEHDEKEEYKSMNQWNTFPAVFFVDSYDQKYLIGGFSELEKIITFYKKFVGIADAATLSKEVKDLQVCKNRSPEDCLTIILEIFKFLKKKVKSVDVTVGSRRVPLPSKPVSLVNVKPFPFTYTGNIPIPGRL